MPHVIIEYSGNLDEKVEMRSLCVSLSEAVRNTGIFSPAGIRVRAIRCRDFVIADGNPANVFVDISIRIRGGRPADLKQRVVDGVFAAARGFFDNHLPKTPLALSLELRDIDPAYSPKLNTIRKSNRGS